MTELATAYVSVLLETSRVPGQLRTMFSGAGREATTAGRTAGQSFSSALGGSLKNLGAVAGVTGAVAAVGGAMKSAISSGMDFTTSLNTMQAVAGASSEQVAKVAQVARDLGTDNQLAATSSVDAAQAMVELAKGGFTVNQSMQAARGTLQLAAAAQISAADAATIQSQALQAFGKDASYAGTAADILANAANQSSAEITDVAMAFQQGGAVANQFGLSMQDTAATIALLANAGIQGSDAGTLLKSALLALTDTGKPAQNAIEQLGLTVYNAQGQFVGMESLFGQLQTASKRMTPEMYQAATATLFGSDAARIAGVAAQQGAGGFDRLRDAMGQQGSAAEVAAAKMQGLPGAWEKLKNEAQDAGLAFYDAVQGPLTSAATAAAGAIGSITDGASGLGSKIRDGFEGIVDAFQNAGGPALIMEWGGRLKDVFTSLWGSIEDLLPLVGTLGETFGQAGAIVSAIGVETLVSGLEAAAGILDATVVPALQLTNSALSGMQPLVVGAVAAWLAFRAVGPALAGLRSSVATLGATTTTATARLTSLATAQSAVVRAGSFGAVSMGRFGTAIAQVGQSAPVVARMQSSFVNAATGAERFGRTAGIASAAGTGLRAAGAGIAGVFGGPVGLALAGAAVVGTMWASSVQRQSSAVDAYRGSLASLAEEQKRTKELLVDSKGALTGDVFSSVASQVDDVRDSFTNAGKATASWNDALVSGLTFGLNDQEKKVNETASANREAAEAINNLGMTSQAVGRQVAGSASGWDQLKARLLAMPEGGQKAAETLQDVRNKILQQQDVGRRVTPGITELGTAFQVMGDKSSSASDKLNALKSAMDAMNPARSQTEAVAQYGEAIRKVATSTDGINGTAFDPAGKFNAMSEAGANLSRTLADLADKSAQVASTGGDMGTVNAQNEQAFQALATATGQSVQTIRGLYESLGGKAVDLSVQLKGAPEVTQQLAAISAQWNNTPEKKTIEVEESSVNADTRAALERLHATVSQPMNGIVTITANDDRARAQLLYVSQNVNLLNGLTANPKVGLETDAFTLGNQNARNQLRDLSAQIANPQAKLTIDELLQGKAVSVAQLEQLSATTANPQVRMEVDKILANIALVNSALDRTAQERVAYINAQVTGLNFGDRTPDGGVFRGPGISRASGGPVTGPGGPRDDKVLMWGSNGEFMQQSAAVDYYGLQFMDDVNNMRLPRRATGGPVSKDDFDKLARGGFGASRPLEGAPYVWSGVNWGDCSAAQSAFARLAAGLAPFGGRYATASAASALKSMGASQGIGQSGDLQLGFYNGGPGGGHATTKLPSGVNVEMGGNRGDGQYGGGAADPNEGRFNEKWHFPASMFADSTPPLPTTGVGDDTGGTLSRPDLTTPDMSTTSTTTPRGTSISTRIGGAIGAFFEGQIKSGLDVISANDSPGWLSAITEYENQVEQSKKGGAKNSQELSNAQAQRKYEADKLTRQQAYEAQRDKLQDEKSATKDEGKKAEIDRRLADLKRDYQDATLKAKQQYDAEKLTRRQQSRVADPGTRKPNPGQDLGGVFDDGGEANGLGIMHKRVIRPERVLSPDETQAFQVGMRNGFAGANDRVESLLGELVSLYRAAPPRGQVQYNLRDERGLRLAEEAQRRQISVGLAGR
ncbi:phage tail tape measure protein [Williamsia serinedens]|uniref:Phage tail tape measure protein, TP901 family, core region n=1 Tax=Williamsia serinedens TaxID=391736 RepID=A0ABT1H662_9NOCA|nr:phage tail tape measure protein [Williamsia serinedens]MCP2162656.1 phage tail tape measure protein, TP901 family, core region [Williamsia serinedens]